MSRTVTKKDAERLRTLLSDDGIPEKEHVLFLAQALSFIILGTEVNVLSSYMRKQSTKYAFRKLRSVVNLLERTFGL